MGEMSTEEMRQEEVTNKVTEYVNANYRTLKGKELKIVEADNCFKVYSHKDGGPLILGKRILDL